jgi:hypothetical protein
MPVGRESRTASGQDEALVLGREHQVDEGEHHEEDVERFVAALRLVVRQALPRDVVAARERARGDLADRVDGVAARVAGGGSPRIADEL